MTEYAVQCKELIINYPNFRLYVPDFAIPKGFVMGLVGKNGAGKSTLIRALLEIIPRAKGEIEICGLDFKHHEMKIKNKIGYVNDTFVFPPEATAEQMGKQIGQFYDSFDERLYLQLLKKHQLRPNEKFKNYSKGMCAKFSILFAVAHHADVLILDEPTANLDPVSRREVLDMLYELMQDEEKTILFSTHITSDLDQIADYITLIDNGKIEFTLSKDELQENHQIVTIHCEIPADIKSSLKGIKKTNDGFTALCTETQKYKHMNNIQFRKASIEDLMVYWELKHE